MLKNKLFPAQEESENVLLVVRRHWFTYMIFVFIVVVMLIPLILAIIYISYYGNNLEQETISTIILSISAYILIILGLALYGFIDYYLDVYIVTDMRIVDIKQDGFFKRAISELNLRQVQDVNARVNGIFPTLFHYGDVIIQTAGERENFVFISIPHPYETSKKIVDLHREHSKTVEISSESQSNKNNLKKESKF